MGSCPTGTGAVGPPGNIVARATWFDAAPGAEILEPILSFPPSWGDESKTSLRGSAFATALSGDYLVRLANAATTGGSSIVADRIALERHRQLLTPAVVKQLAQVEFLETTTGGRVARARPTSAMPALFWLSETHIRGRPFRTASLSPGLKCRTEPSVNDTIRHLSALKDAGMPLLQAEAVYQLLHEVAKGGTPTAR